MRNCAPAKKLLRIEFEQLIISSYDACTLEKVNIHRCFTEKIFWKISRVSLKVYVAESVFKKVLGWWNVFLKILQTYTCDLTKKVPLAYISKFVRLQQQFSGGTALLKIGLNRRCFPVSLTKTFRATIG